MRVVVEVSGVRKRFGRVEALRGVSFSVLEGEIFCLVGPNGAGKTTTLRIVAGLIRPDGGAVRVFGLDPSGMGLEDRRRLSYLPEDAGVYRNLTGLEYLEFVASVYARSREEALEMVRRGVELSGLGEDLRRRAGGYSKGMKRRLALAAALMVEPELAILDEPTAGLDVAHAVAVRRTVRDYVRSSRASAIVSSHNMLEVEYICDSVALISGGRIVEEGTPSELKDKHGASNLEEVYVKLVGVEAA
ncbi:MAG: ABC transporter ATP-binding protein [Desulfurococcales archaeon]|nr:ABC transporter ATP-binding protein [Desulfurococcales archaeon]